MFEDSREFSKPKTSRLKTKDVKALRRTLQGAFPLCLGTDDEQAEENLNALIPLKAGVNKSVFKSRDVLYSVAGPEKNSKTFVPLFIVMKRGHEVLPTVFALWRCPGLLQSRLYTHAAVAAKLIKSPPADLFLPGVMLPRNASWKKNDLLSLFVARNPMPFAVGRASARVMTLLQAE